MSIEANEISEIFSPALNEEYTNRFQCLVKRIGEVFPNYRDLLIKQEIAATEDGIPDNDFEGLKYITALRVLYDLTQQGWSLEVQNNTNLYLTMLTESSNSKDYIRKRLSTKRKA